MTSKELWEWLDTCPSREWVCTEHEHDYARVIFPFDDPEEDES